MDCSPQGSSVHGILQGRILEWVAISFSRESSQPRARTQVSCIAGRFFTIWATIVYFLFCSDLIKGHTLLSFTSPIVCSNSCPLRWWHIQPSHPLSPPLLLPSPPALGYAYPSVRVFSSELTLCIRWPKYWSLSFSISPSNEYSEL